MKGESLLRVLYFPGTMALRREKTVIHHDFNIEEIITKTTFGVQEVLYIFA